MDRKTDRWIGRQTDGQLKSIVLSCCVVGKVRRYLIFVLRRCGERGAGRGMNRVVAG